MVSQMSTQKEIDELQKTFSGLDKNQDGNKYSWVKKNKGFLSKDELIEGYTVVLKSKKLAMDEVDRILEFVDIN